MGLLILSKQVLTNCRPSAMANHREKIPSCEGELAACGESPSPVRRGFHVAKFPFFFFLLMLLFCLTFFSGSLHTVMESTKVKQASKRWKEKRESNLRQEPFYFHPEPDSVNFSPSSMTVSCGQSPSAPLESKYKAMDIRLNHHWRRLLTSQRE